MNKALGGLLVLAALSTSTTAMAGDKLQRVEFFGTYGQLDAEGLVDDFEGIGGGLRILAGRRDGLFGDLSGEYIPTDTDIGSDTVDLDIENYRAGIGYGLSAFGADSFLQLKVEWASLRTEFEDGARENQNGFGVHVQIEKDFIDGLGVDASVGYLDFEDIDGSEFTVGAHWVPERVGFFLQFRFASLEGKDDSSADAELSSLRAGFRMPF